MKQKTALGVTLSRLIGLMIFLVLLIIANIIQINNSVYLQVIRFLNQNLGIIILFSILLYLGKLFFVFKFPLNLPAPVFNAFGGVFLVEFIFRIFYLIGNFTYQSAFLSFRYLEPLVYVAVFFIVIIVGYVNIFIDIGKRKEKIKEKRKEMKKEKHIEWKDVGEEFRKTAYNIASNIKESLEPKKQRKKMPRKLKKRIQKKKK